MTESEISTSTSTDGADGPADAGLRGQAWAIVITLAAIIAVVVLTFSFSTHNTPMSIDGDRATFSGELED